MGMKIEEQIVTQVARGESNDEPEVDGDIVVTCGKLIISANDNQTSDETDLVPIDLDNKRFALTSISKLDDEDFEAIFEVDSDTDEIGLSENDIKALEILEKNDDIVLTGKVEEAPEDDFSASVLKFQDAIENYTKAVFSGLSETMTDIENATCDKPIFQDDHFSEEAVTIDNRYAGMEPVVEESFHKVKAYVCGNSDETQNSDLSPTTEDTFEKIEFTMDHEETDQHFLEDLQNNETNENHMVESTDIMVANQGEERPLIESIIRPSDIPKLLDDQPNHSHTDEETFEDTENNIQTQQQDTKILYEEKDSANNINQIIDDDENLDHTESLQEYGHNLQVEDIKENNICTYETNGKEETVDFQEANFQAQQQETIKAQEHIKHADEEQNEGKSKLQPEEGETNFSEEITGGDVHHDIKAQNDISSDVIDTLSERNYETTNAIESASNELECNDDNVISMDEKNERTDDKVKVTLVVDVNNLQSIESDVSVKSLENNDVTPQIDIETKKQDNSSHSQNELFHGQTLEMENELGPLSSKGLQRNRESRKSKKRIKIKKDVWQDDNYKRSVEKTTDNQLLIHSLLLTAFIIFLILMFGSISETVDIENEEKITSRIVTPVSNIIEGYIQLSSLSEVELRK